ncbi:substrate-binding domain-containing protein [Paenibacillus ginsengihumi]|uniref:LacI family DNA-binding transcriptional regulator n=1 Tax=Paenibacillus ginsengihumi TaxID=431596 RepID=UPI00036D7FE7
MTVKMEDIARLAGVSKSAVSLALSGKPGIGAETREKIVRIAKEHGYPIKARSAAAAKSGALTLLVFANSGIVLEQYYDQPFFRELIPFIEERCRARGFSLLFSSLDGDAPVEGLAASIEGTGSDGVILLGTNLSKSQVADIAGRLGCPLVVLDTCFDTLPVHFIEINNRMGAYQAGVHLCELGHTRIGYIQSNVRIHNFAERQRGFAEALQERGLAVADKHTLSVAPTILSSQEELKQQLQSLIAAGEPLPTAFFCECDYIAISAMKTLSELGWRIPEDISVIGFDNISESRIVSPELTTVHVAKKQIAYHAVDLLMQELEAEDQDKVKIKVDTHFVERSSTAPPKL